VCSGFFGLAATIFVALFVQPFHDYLAGQDGATDAAPMSSIFQFLEVFWFQPYGIRFRIGLPSPLRHPLSLISEPLSGILTRISITLRCLEVTKGYTSGTIPSNGDV